MPPLNLLIKPASGSCNMRCRYCFYTDEAQKREVGSYGRMSRETAEILVDRAMGCDNSWGKSANEYIRLYKQILKN